VACWVVVGGGGVVGGGCGVWRGGGVAGGVVWFFALTGSPSQWSLSKILLHQL